MAPLKIAPPFGKNETKFALKLPSNIWQPKAELKRATQFSITGRTCCVFCKFVRTVFWVCHNPDLNRPVFWQQSLHVHSSSCLFLILFSFWHTHTHGYELGRDWLRYSQKMDILHKKVCCLPVTSAGDVNTECHRCSGRRQRRRLMMMRGGKRASLWGHKSELGSRSVHRWRELVRTRLDTSWSGSGKLTQTHIKQSRFIAATLFETRCGCYPIIIQQCQLVFKGWVKKKWTGLIFLRFNCQF